MRLNEQVVTEATAASMHNASIEDVEPTRKARLS